MQVCIPVRTNLGPLLLFLLRCTFCINYVLFENFSKMSNWILLRIFGWINNSLVCVFVSCISSNTQKKVNKFHSLKILYLNHFPLSSFRRISVFSGYFCNTDMKNILLSIIKQFIMIGNLLDEVLQYNKVLNFVRGVLYRF